MYLRVIQFALLAILPVWLCSCKEKDGNHPLYFKAGRELRNNRIQDAVTLYKQYLKINPDSAEAHKKLATIYDDRLNQPINAIYHYQRYLELAPPDASDRDAVPKWIESAEHKYYLQLKDRFNDPEDINTLRFELDKTGKALKDNQYKAAVYRKHLIMYAKKNQQLTDYLNRIKSTNGEYFTTAPAPVNIPEKEKDSVLNSNVIADTTVTSSIQSESAVENAKGTNENSEQHLESKVPIDPVINSRRRMFIQPQPQNEKKYPMRTSLSGPTEKVEKEKTSFPTFYKVENGDTLSMISRKFYGSGNYYHIILEANKNILNDASALRPGMTLKIPERKER